MNYHYQIEEGKGQEEHTTEEWSIIEENEKKAKQLNYRAILKILTGKTYADNSDLNY